MVAVNAIPSLSLSLLQLRKVGDGGICAGNIFWCRLIDVIDHQSLVLDGSHILSSIPRWRENAYINWIPPILSWMASSDASLLDVSEAPHIRSLTPSLATTAQRLAQNTSAPGINLELKKTGL
mmetsp:Transcript_29663/g.54393  ORF Transcript_29663/g.54393 Transcript_29663/m.54393 type:complete len:123 (-) Transcript_29663:246-614(-)